jgi:hypothetical protein
LDTSESRSVVPWKLQNLVPERTEKTSWNKCVRNEIIYGLKKILQNLTSHAPNILRLQEAARKMKRDKIRPLY